MNISLSIIAEFLSLSVALFCFRQLKGSIYFYFIPFLFFLVYGEIGAVYFYYNVPESYLNGNTHIYLWISIFEIIFYSYLFYHFFSNKLMKKLILAIAFLVVNFYLFLFFFYTVYVEAFYYVLTLVGIYLTLLSCIFFYQLFQRDEEGEALSSPDLWIVSGIFVFFTGTCLTFVLHKTLTGPDRWLFGQPLYNLIPQVLSIILYGFFAKAFMLCRKKVKTSS